MNRRPYRVSAILLLLLLGAATLSAMAMAPGGMQSRSWWDRLFPRHDALYTPTPTKTPQLRVAAAPTATPIPTARPMPTLKPTAVAATPRPTGTAARLGTNWLSLADSYGLDRRGRWIIVDQDHQVMVIGEADSVVKVLPVSTGAPGKDTTPAWIGVVGKYWGTFEAADGSYADNAWYLFPHNGAILIHSAPYFMDDGHKKYQDLDALGHEPVSHGCIRMAPRDAEWFTKWDPLGVPILITPCNCDR